MAVLLWVALLSLCGALGGPTGALARMGHLGPNPLMDDPPRGHHNKANSRAAECVFGKQTREIGSTWFADLGPPFGVMYCIRCECIPIQKKRRIVARVQCRNIKHECPEPTCEEPVLLPNRCCKVCPGDSDSHLHSPDVVQDVAPTVSAEEEDKNWKHFGALLTGRTSRLLAHAVQGSGLVAPPRNVGNHVATARFTFHRKSLYYSVLTPRRPRAIQFVDREGSILEEQSIQPHGSAYQNATGKVCGVWRRLSKDYRRLLREDRLLVTLLWENEDSVTGAVQRVRSLGSELLSALLLPVGGVSSEQHPLAGAGGTAIVSISSSGPAPSVHVALLFNGIFSPQDLQDVPVSVRLETADGSRQVLDETVRVAKPGAELNEASVTAALPSSDLRLLTRGKLILTVSSASPRRPRQLALSGAVQPRAVCEIFQAPLSVAEAAAEQLEDSSSGSGSSQAIAGVDSADSVVVDRPAGQAWLYVDRHGALVYSVQLSQVPGETTLLALVSGRGRRSVELEDLTPALHASQGQGQVQGPRGAPKGGWANGTVSRLSPRELEQLYAGELAVNVATGSAASLVRGRLVARPVADARDSPQPILLTPKQGPTGSSIRIPVKGVAGNLTGMAWFAIDQDCNLNYDVSLSPGAPSGTAASPLLLALEQVPFLAPGAPVFRRVLDELTTPSTQHEGGGIALAHAELSRLDAGVSYVDVVLPDGAELRGELRQVTVPAFCLPHYSDNDVPSMSAGQPSGSGEPETLHCFHETRFYEDGAQWVSAQDACTMCSCHRAKVQCDAVVCPPLRCENPVPAGPGQCCGHCAAPTAVQTAAADSAPTTPAGCKLGGQFHAAGTSWHPYVPPNGFDTCAVCTCNASSLETRCERTQCPPLTCSEHEAVRPEPRACCKKCPAPKAPVSVPSGPSPLQGEQGEQAAPKTMEEILGEGGCKNPLGKPHLNGDEWHPRISSHGEYKCVTCRCKDGKVKCDRKRCTRSSCEGQGQGPTGQGHAHQALRRSSALHAHAHAHGQREDACCMAQCRRFRRHHNKPKNEHRNEPRR